MSKKKKLFYINSIIIILIFFVSIPKILSSTCFGNKIICYYLKKHLNSEVSISKISLSFFGKQKIINLKIQNQNYCFSSEIFLLNQSIFSLITKNYITDINIENFKIKKETKLNKESKIEKKTNNFSYISKIENIKLSNGSFQIGKIVFDNIFLYKSKHKILSYGKSLNKDINGHFFIEVLTNPLTSITTNIQNIPISIFFDQENKQNFPYERINISFSTQNKELFGTIQSSNNDIKGTIEGYIENNSVILKQNSSYLCFKSDILTYFLSKKIKKYVEFKEKNINIFSSIKEGIFYIKDIKNSSFNIISKIESLKLCTKNNKSYSINNIIIKSKKSNFYSLNLEGNFNYKNENSNFNVSIINLPSLKETNIKINHLTIHKDLINQYLPEYIPKTMLSTNKISILGEFVFFNNILTGNIDIKSDTLLTKLEISNKQDIYKINLHGTYFPLENIKIYFPRISKIYFDFHGNLNECKNYSIHLLGKIFSDEFFINIKAKNDSICKASKLNNTCISIQGKINNLIYKNSLLPLVNIDNSHLFFYFDSKNNKLTGSSLLNINTIQSNSISPSFSLSFDEITINNLFTEEKINYLNFKSFFYGKIKNLSKESLNSFYPIPFPLSSLIEKNSSISFSGNINESKFSDHFLTINSQMNTSNLSINNLWFFNKSLQITSSSNSKIEILLNKKTYENIIKKISIKPDCILNKDATFTLDIYPSKNFSYEQLEGTLSSKSITFKSNSTQEESSINDIEGLIKLNLKNKNFNYQIKGFINKDSFIESSGLLENNSYTGKAFFKNLPSFLFFGTLPIPLSLKKLLEHLSENKITQLLEWNIKNHTGTCICNFKSPNIKAEIPLEIHDKFITLSNTAKLHLALNKNLIDTIVKDFSLFSIHENNSLIVSLDIEKTNVFIPLCPYDFKNIIIGLGYLNLGKIQIIKNDKLNQLFDFLNIKDEHSLIEAWFTPIYFNIKNGILTYKRFDLLINKAIHLAFWGKTNLLNKYINLILGIEPSSLEKILKIYSLPKKNFFLVKIQGPLNNPSIDWSSAYSRLSILSAASTGGHLGSLFGGVLDKFLSALGGPTPPPSTNPFPWEVEK